jgi:hypothetical protein
MKGLMRILLAAGSAAAFFGMANAQPSGPRAVLFDQPNFQGRSITIVDGTPDLGRWGFAGRVMSAQFEGDWTVCDAPDLDGQCASVRGAVADLGQTGLRRVVSLGGTAQEDEAGDDARSAPTRYAMADEAPRTARAGADAAGDEIVPRPRSSGPPEPPPAAVAAAPGPAAASAAVAAPAPSAPPAAQAAAAPPAASLASVTAADAGRSAVFFATPTRGGSQVAVDVQGPANQFCHDQGLGAAVYADTDGRVLRDVLCRRP